MVDKERIKKDYEIFKSNSRLPMAVVLGLVDTGYGIVRSLSLNKIPVIAFENKRDLPELMTSLCEIQIYRTHEDLLEKLLILAQKLDYKAVLFLSSDDLVNFFSCNYSVLSKYFQIDFPCAATVNLLLDKTQFTEFAEHHNFIIPKTEIVTSLDDVHRIEQSLFPCIVKPFLRTEKWQRAKFPKVYSFDTRSDFHNNIEDILKVEKKILVQQLVPGSDRNLYFCLAYYNDKSECITSFTGRKLRVGNIRYGDITCTEPKNAPIVHYETLRLFNFLSFKGFGSVEFKRHPKSGEFYIIEPTVGRLDHQSFLATANGVNMPSQAYSSMTGIRFETPRQGKNVLWIDEINDLVCITLSIRQRQLVWSDLLRTLYLKKSFRFFNTRDIWPSISLWYGFIKKVLKRLIRR